MLAGGFSKTKDYAKNRLRIMLHNESDACQAERMQQIIKEIKEIIGKHLNISEDAYEIKIVLKEDRKRD